MAIRRVGLEELVDGVRLKGPDGILVVTLLQDNYLHHGIFLVSTLLAQLVPAAWLIWEELEACLATPSVKGGRSRSRSSSSRGTVRRLLKETYR